MSTLDLGESGLELGGHILLKHALSTLPVDAELQVAGTSAALDVHLRAWCRAHGHGFRALATGFAVRRGGAEAERWSGSERAGSVSAPASQAERRWGLAARGARVEAGVPEFGFSLVERGELWSDDAARIYAQATASQWDPETAIPWQARFELPEEVEDAVVQLMTYLVENELAALIIPSSFIARMHPHFREVMQLLAVQAADEARHVEVFSRRAALKRAELGLSAVSGQASLKTLIDESDFATASFLLSVLGEGTFLSLLHFIEANAPDPVTAAVARLAGQDEARHVAFGLAHLREHILRDPELRGRLAAAVRLRHESLRHTAGLAHEVFDALVVLAAGAWTREAIRDGYRRVQELQREMHEMRAHRLVRLGFDQATAADLSSLHTRNFM